jgi:hypothetical protein
MKKLLFSLFLLPMAGLLNAQSLAFGFIPSLGTCLTPVSGNYMYTITMTSTVATATSYSWNAITSNCTSTMFTNPSGYGGLFMSPCTGPFTLTCYALNGSSTLTSATYTGSFLGAPALTVAATPNNGTGCAGTTFTMNISGGGTTYNTVPGSFAGNVVVVTPSITTTYTVYSTAANGCTMQTQKTLVLTAPPTVSINASGNSCGAKVLTASGAQTYTWNTGSNAPTITVNAPAMACYTVLGSTNGCPGTSSAVACVTVYAYPTITVSGSTIQCLGSSFNFTASGASTYSWVNNTSGPVLQVTPLTTTTYSVYGNNGICSSGTAVTANVDTLCAIVWPGDANRDGVVSSSDVLELGLYASSTGASRSGASNSWTGQYATAWNGHNSTGWNRAHVDCNGDGTVDAADTTAISLNFSNTHSFRQSGSNAVDPDITLIPQTAAAYPGIWNKIDVMFGSSTGPVSNLYGVAFDLGFDAATIELNQVKLVYTSSFLNNGNQNIEFAKKVTSAGKVYAATVRTNHNNVNGSGKIGEIWFQVKNNLTDNTPVNFTTSQAVKVSAAGTPVSITSGNTSMGISNNVTGLSKGSALMVAVYPNPARETLMLTSDSKGLVNFELRDVTGRIMSTGSFTGRQPLDVSSFEKGSYLVTFSGENQAPVSRIVILQ